MSMRRRRADGARDTNRVGLGQLADSSRRDGALGDNQQGGGRGTWRLDGSLLKDGADEPLGRLGDEGTAVQSRSGGNANSRE